MPLYEVRVSLKGTAVYKIEAPSEEEAELAVEDLWVEDPDVAANLDVLSIDARRTVDDRSY